MRNVFESKNLKNVIHSGSHFFLLTCKETGVTVNQDVIEAVAVLIAYSFAYGADASMHGDGGDRIQLELPKAGSEEWNRRITDLVVSITSHNGSPAR